jgi:hypothetical protein
MSDVKGQKHLNVEVGMVKRRAEISDQQQRGYEDGSWKGPKPPLLGAAVLYQSKDGTSTKTLGPFNSENPIC